MLFFTIAIATLIGGFNPRFAEAGSNKPRYISGWLFRVVFLGLINWWVAYVNLFSWVGPLGGLVSACLGLTVLTLLVNMVITLLDGAAQSDLEGRDFMAPAWALGLALVFVILATAFSGPVFNADVYQRMIGEVTESHWSETMALAPLESADTRHIRMVSRSQAAWKGNQVLGQASGALGSRYHVGEYAIQRVQGELWWVAPLEFNDYWKWRKYQFTPGFVMVSAEDDQRPAQLHTDYEYQYVYKTWFAKQLRRHLYVSGYYNYRLRDFTFELDEDLKGHWVVTLIRPTLMWSKEVVAGIVVVDPETGDIDRYDVDDVPEWVDRVIPEYLATNYIQWNGSLKQGWWNSVTAQENVIQATDMDNGSNLWMVWGSQDSEPYWFTGMTSAASTDQALTGFMLVNSRTGKASYYTLSGANEAAVEDVVNTAVSNYKDFRATQPILYNLYGNLAWVVPVVSAEGIFQRLAIVDAHTAKACLGENKKEALAAYRRLLSENSNLEVPSMTVSTRSITTSVSRITADVQGGVSTYYLLVTDVGNHLFIGTSVISSELPVTRQGDEVSISYDDSGEGVLSLLTFDNLNIKLAETSEQAEVEESWTRSEQEGQDLSEDHDAKRIIEGLSPDELKDLLKENAIDNN